MFACYTVTVHICVRTIENILSRFSRAAADRLSCYNGVKRMSRGAYGTAINALQVARSERGPNLLACVSSTHHHDTSAIPHMPCTTQAQSTVLQPSSRTTVILIRRLNKYLSFPRVACPCVVPGVTFPARQKPARGFRPAWMERRSWAPRRKTAGEKRCPLHPPKR